MSDISDIVVWGLPGASWQLLGVAGLVGMAAAWLTVLLLVHPVRPLGIPGVLSLQGVIGTRADDLALFAARHLVAGLPPPRRFLEHLGPDRFRREISQALRARIDEHVDDVMTRRDGQSWILLPGYTRDRIYTHVHRRLPYVVDDFVEQLHRDLDDLIHPALLVRRYFAERPEAAARLFVDIFGKNLRRLLPLAGLSGALAGGLAAVLTAGQLSVTPALVLVLVLAAASATGCLVLLLALTWPVSRRGVWPLQTQGILHRQRSRFLRALSRQVVNDALAWQAVTGEIFHGTHAPRLRRIMKREVAGILDMPVFRASLQLLLGLEGFADARRSALEKAMEVISATPVSAALRSHYRLELERTIEHAAANVLPQAYTELWQSILRPAWKILPLLLAATGFSVGLLLNWLSVSL